jgi:hypothetical protein
MPYFLLFILKNVDTIARWYAGLANYSRSPEGKDMLPMWSLVLGIISFVVATLIGILALVLGVIAIIVGIVIPLMH